MQPNIGIKQEFPAETAHSRGRVPLDELVHLRENIDGYATAFHDRGSSDYIPGLLETHEIMAWMLRAAPLNKHLTLNL